MKLENFLTSKGIGWKLGRNGSYQVCCPLCGDRRFRLGVSSVKRAAHCFNCRWRGSVYALIKRLNDGAGLRIDDVLPVGRTDAGVIDLPSDFQLLADVAGDGEFGYGALRAYALARGLMDADLERYHVGGCLEGKQGNRVVFPIFDGTTLYSYVGRSVYGAEPKYLNATGGTQALWGFENRPSSTLILTEGIIKSIAMQRVAPHALHCAMLRNSLSEFQYEQIMRLAPKRLILIPDPGGAGVEGALEIMERIPIEIPLPLPELQADEATAAKRLEWLRSLQRTSIRVRRELQRQWLKEGVYY